MQDARRAAPSVRGYDDDHKRLRVKAFQPDNWTCLDCGWQPDIVRDSNLYDLNEPSTDVILAELRDRWREAASHLHGDHDLAIQNRPDLRLDLNNCRTLCNLCHAAKTMKETLSRLPTSP